MLQDYVVCFVGVVGFCVVWVESMVEFNVVLMDIVVQRWVDVEGVNLDEELVVMMMYQQFYNVLVCML